MLPTRALRAAGLILMALAIAHCGDSDVDVVGGGNIDPTAGTFVGATNNGGVVTIQVGSVEAIALLCSGSSSGGSCSPAVEVVNSNATGTCGGVTFDVTFTSNNEVEINDISGGTDCDGSGSATRTTGGIPTMTPGPGVTATPTTGGGGEATPTPTMTPEGPTVVPTSVASCPTAVEFVGDPTQSVTKLDPGWTGLAHDASVISEGKITVSVTSCASASPPCGVCNLTGPIPNRTGIQSQRCSGNLSTHCTGDGDCSGAGTCEFYLGSFLPLSAGGVSTCVLNEVAGTVSGTGNVETGTSASSAPLTSKVFLGLDPAEPCPKCNGDPTPNDGNQGGTCSGGARNGMPCDTNGSSTVPSFGSTSFDCPFAGMPISNLPINLELTTGTTTRTLSASNPNCRGVGFTTRKCFCDVCTGGGNEPCGSSADCPSSEVCGGNRCLPPGDGSACTSSADCGGTPCSGVGAATQSNQCLDTICTAGECSTSGPFENFCVIENFRGCLGNADCPASGDTCGAETRPCFDSGELGETVSASGQADPPDANGAGNPTLASLFCIAPVGAAAVNTSAGLPGLGRVVLRGSSQNLFD